MSASKFRRAAQFNRAKAVFFTVIFHVLLIGALFYGGEAKIKQYVPDEVLSILGIDQDQPVEEAQANVEKP